MGDLNFNKENMIRWYNEHSENYDQESFTQSDDLYGGDAFRIELVAQTLKQLKPKSVLDIGCGTGMPMMRLLQEGFNVRGFDLSPGMIEQAKKKLVAKGQDPKLAEVGDLLDPKLPEKYGREAFDCVIANGVFPYLGPKECEIGHKNILQILKPGGWYLGAYTNELFDMFTLNRFTVNFYKKHFIDPLAVSEKEKAEIMEDIKDLLTHPDAPASIPEGARDSIYVGGHNPLTLGNDLKAMGLIQKDIMFYKFHAFQPLLKKKNPERQKAFMKLSRDYEVKQAKDWMGYFLASTFIVVCQKN